MSERRWIQDALERFEGPLLLYARRLLGDPEAARDAVQETFLRLCRHSRAEIEPRLAEWLYTVCRNVSLDVQRRKRNMNPEGAIEATPPLDASGPEQEALQREEKGRMLAELDLLPPKQQEVLRLKFQGGLSYREISRVTGDSIGNVGYLIHVGLKSLRGRLVIDATERRVS
jgi:RNA polymerase sigma-70 factor (ECF subfamily)